MISVCLPSDALSQHPLSYLGFSYVGHGISLHGCSSKAQLLLRTLDEGYLLRAAPPDLECGVAPLGPPEPAQLPLLGCGVTPLGLECTLSTDKYVALRLTCTVYRRAMRQTTTRVRLC